jgi:hypothetical protein
MLTDTEVADTARQLLADELAGLAPPAALLAVVRARNAARRRARRVATAGLACAAAAVIGVVLAGPTAGAPGRSDPAASMAGLEDGPARLPADPVAQTITLDGYTIGLTRSLQTLLVSQGKSMRAATGPGHALTFTSRAGRQTGNSGPRTLTFSFLLAREIPAAAVRVRVTGQVRAVYLLRASRKVSIYVPLPVPDGQFRVLAISADTGDQSVLLRIATVLRLDLRPGPRGTAGLRKSS